MGEGGVVVERGLDYGLGKLADVYWPERDAPAPGTRWAAEPVPAAALAEADAPPAIAAAGR